MENKLPSSITLNELKIFKPFNVDRKVVTLEMSGDYRMTLLTMEEVQKLNEYLTNILREK